MEFKEKIIRYWLTFILTFLGFSKSLIIIPVFLQFDIYNRYLVSAINFIFTPAIYASDFLVKWFIFSSFQTGAPILLFNPIIAIVKLALIAGESYILAWVIIFLLKRESAKNLFFRYFYIIKERLKMIATVPVSPVENYNSTIVSPKQRQMKIILIAILVIMILGFGGYFIFKNYRSQEQIKVSVITDEEKRDNQRLENIVKIKEVLENYAKENKGFYPKTDGIEKISDGKSSSFLALQKGNYISKLYIDPLPDKYYGYSSDGKSYELTAVLEKQKDKCVQEGEICVYRIRNDNEKLLEELAVRNPPVVSNPCNPSTVLDIDGNIYNTAKIGTQCWMKENLKVTKNSQGKQIDRDCYDNNPEICNTDGGLYTWLATMNIIVSNISTFKDSIQARESAQGICPDGWHVPRDSEWSTLENYLEENKVKTASGSFMLCSGADGYWLDPCGSAGTKLRQGGSSGFEAIFAGSVENSYSPIALPNEFWYEEYLYKSNWEDISVASNFSFRGESAYFWSSTSLSPFSPQGYPNTRLYKAWYRKLSSVHGGTLKDHRIKSRGGMSVRCLKNY